VLYRADATAGWTGWGRGGGWQVAEGVLTNDGTNADPKAWLAAPWQPAGIASYAVEAAIQWRGRGAVAEPSCGLVAAAGAAGATWVGVGAQGSSFAAAVVAGDATAGAGGPTLATRAFAPGKAWHSYRVEVRGEEFRLLIDGQPVVAAADAREPVAEHLGLWSAGVVLAVRRFAVTAL
jgi:hypothetical protein